MTPSNLYCPDTLSQPTYYIPITCLHHLCVPSFTHLTTPQSTSSAVQPMPDLPLMVSPRHPPPQSCPHALFTWSCSAFAYLLPEPELTFQLLWTILFFLLQRHISPVCWKVCVPWHASDADGRFGRAGGRPEDNTAGLAHQSAAGHSSVVHTHMHENFQ